ncbi:MAG: hypothetical protein QNJ55_30450 [Xenococcus sp. MO_188.B8]|nr:hypothetical protein [Xenococcus sp. MO_188.B8]
MSNKNNTQTSRREFVSRISDSNKKSSSRASEPNVIHEIASRVSKFLQAFTSPKRESISTVEVTETVVKITEYDKLFSAISAPIEKSKISVSVTLQKKPNFLKLFQKLDTTPELKVKAEQLKVLVDELSQPQTIEIKIKELYEEDESELWKIGQSRQESLKYLIEKSLAGKLKQSFKIVSWSFSRGCLSIIAVLTFLFKSASVIADFLKNYDQIKKNAKAFYQDIKKLEGVLSNIYQEFSNGLENVIQAISGWFNSDGWGFA